MDYVEARPQSDVPLALKGEWTVSNVSAIEESVSRHEGEETLSRIDARGIEDLDTTGAWLMHKHFPDAEFTNLSRRHRELVDFVPAQVEKPAAKEPPAPFYLSFFVKVGEAAYWSCDYTYALFSFVGMVFVRAFKNLVRPRRFRFPSIVRHMYETGVQALPIISLLAFGISMVISYQGAVQLRKFGADIYTIDLTVISLLREMAVLTTAIMVAGRSGSAFAAEIGVMKTRGEIDALQTMGMDPFETLVIPRLVALLVTLPALSFIADMVGLAGGGLTSIVQLDISVPQYVSRVQTVATPTMFFIGMIKAPVFAFLITAVCTYQGMNAKGSAENVGKLTTVAVVQSIFLVIMADAIFSVVFSRVGL